jgi:hypothetical protein
MSRLRRLLSPFSPWVALLLAAPLLGACGNVQMYRYPLGAVSTAYGGRPTVSFEGSELLNAPMQELAMVEAVGSGTNADTESVVNALIFMGQTFGASAIVKVRVDCGFGQCHGYGVAVRYLAP